MRTVTERLKSALTFSEMKAVKEIAKELDGRNELSIVISNISNKVNISKSILNTSLRLLEVVGIIETIGMGAKGTHVKVLDKEVLKEVANI